MRNKTLIVGAAACVVLGAAALFFGVANTRDGAFIDPSDHALVSQGAPIYASHCGACHGANLEGQPAWRDRLPNGRLPAPPHDETGHTWHHPDAVLIDIVKNGLVPGKTAPDGYESDMPAYGKTLSDTEIIAVLAFIKSRWPKGALEAQREVTMNSKQ